VLVPVNDKEMKVMILITGASGTVGRAVLDEVRRKRLPAKAMYRNADDAAKVPSGTDAALADFADKPSLRKALAGIDTLFLVCSPIPQLVELESNMIDACRETGVKHIVLNSALGAEDYPKSFPGWHRTVEDKLKSCGLGHTILRPNSFMQNIVAFFAPTIRTQGAFYAAMDNAKVSLIDVRDVGAAAANIMSAPQAHAGKTYELNGPEAVTYAEVAQRISHEMGHAARFVDIPEDAQRKAMLDAGMPQWQVAALLELQQYYTRLGKGGEVTDVLTSLLGRQPMTLVQFLHEFRDSFRSQAATA
jgi:uncharacterized protein YbjT (DUF2867 family)